MCSERGFNSSTSFGGIYRWNPGLLFTALFKDTTSLWSKTHIAQLLLHSFYSPGIFVPRFGTAPQVIPSGQCLFLSLCPKIESAVCSQTESSWLIRKDQLIKDQLREGGVRNHTVFSKVWTYSRNSLQSKPLGLLWGLLQICHSTHIPPLDSARKGKKEQLTNNYDWFWLPLTFLQNFLLWH